MKHLKPMNENLKPQLKMETITTHEVDYSDFEEFVQEIYGFNYESVAENEWNNDSNYTANITGKLDKWDVEKATQIRAGKCPAYANYHILLEVLCADGYIPAGHYTINVSW